MELTQELLHKRICDVEPEATNEETYAEFIKEAEEGFDMRPLDLETMTTEELTEYMDYIDYLYGK